MGGVFKASVLKRLLFVMFAAKGGHDDIIMLSLLLFISNGHPSRLRQEQGDICELQSFALVRKFLYSVDMALEYSLAVSSQLDGWLIGSPCALITETSLHFSCLSSSTPKEPWSTSIHTTLACDGFSLAEKMSSIAF